MSWQLEMKFINDFSTKAGRQLYNEEEIPSEIIKERTTYKRIPNLEMMELSKLSTQQIADLLHTLLVNSEEDDDDDYLLSLLELARIVKEKTQGNTFVVIQFLRLLEREDMFVYDQEHRRWKFDVSSIAIVDYQSENVAKVVTGPSRCLYFVHFPKLKSPGGI
jgi:predicted ATPase